MKILMKKNLCVAKKFNDTIRYIDDLLTVNNSKFEKEICNIYPPELTLKRTSESERNLSYLDISISICGGKYVTEVYDKSISTKAHASGVSLTLCSSISRSHAQTHYSHALSIRPSRSLLGRYYYTTDGPARRPVWSAVSGTRLRLTAVSCVDLGSSPCQDCRCRHIGYYPVR